MSNIVEKPVLFSLYSLSSRQDGSCKVSLKLFEIQDKSTLYVDFFFSSIDYMILYLRILARSSKSYSINNLMSNSYEARIKYEMRFNAPNKFIAFYLMNGHEWPNKNTYAMFKNDFMV